MAMGRYRSSSSRLARSRKRRSEDRKAQALRKLQVEVLDDRRLLATGPQLIGIQPNSGDLLKDGDVLNVAPRELTFQFNEGQSIDAASLDAIQLLRAGGDGDFEGATARTDFNTKGAVIVEFRAVTPGAAGNDIELQFSKADRGAAGAPRISVEGKTIFVELNSSRGSKTTATALVSAINNHVDAKQLVSATLFYGPGLTDITTPDVTYSPLDLGGANAAYATSSFNTGKSLEVRFTAVAAGVDGNGIQIAFSKQDFGGAHDPVITVADGRTIQVQLNSHAGTQTTSSQLVSAFNANGAARALVVASLSAGDPTADVATPAINYSPLTLQGANDVAITPGYLGLDEDPRKVIYRFAETLPDDLYRIDIQGSGTAPLRNTAGMALGDATDDGTDNGVDFARQFELDLAPQIVAVVPQPINRTTSGALSQATNQIEVYFNDDDLDPVTATNPAFYQLIRTSETVPNTDDRVFRPIAVQYFPESDRAMLTFSAPLYQLIGGSGTFRLRIGTDEAIPAAPAAVDLTDTDAGSSFTAAYDLSAFSGSAVISAAVDPKVYPLDFPGASDEPGHRDIPALSIYGEQHLLSSADPVNGIQTLYYNFRKDYGADPAGNVLQNLITDEQKHRAREILDLYAQYLGVQFVETATQGFTVATGDLRTVDPTVPTGTGGVYGIAGDSLRNQQPMVVLDNAENWYNAYGRSDDARPSWFEVAFNQIGQILGLGSAADLPAGTVMSSQTMATTAEAVYPGDQDIVHGQYLYRPEGSDIDLYRFELTSDGEFTAETVAERQATSSLLDSALALYREVDGQRELVARNDDYFSNDSLIRLDLVAGTYYIGVSASGNTDYDPTVEDSGLGGRSEGKYDLRLTFRPTSSNGIRDLDNWNKTGANQTTRATTLDGDGDGEPGGVYNFWFRVDSTPLIVDKAATVNGAGTLSSPFNNIASALTAARAGDVVRIVGNGGTDGLLETPENARPYLIGFDQLGRPLADGSTLNVPRGVTVVVDRGVVFKLRAARIGVGSSSATVDRSAGALQVLGTPRLIDAAGKVVVDSTGTAVPGSVYFTALNDDTLGGDTNPSITTGPQAGDWGGIVFRRDLDAAASPTRFDYEKQGIFLDYVNHADLRYGGGTVLVEGVPQQIAPLHLTDDRPTITNNTVRWSLQAPISANPDSFAETDFQAPEYQAVPFTPDYLRIGPEVHGNRLMDNTVNGLFVRLKTPAGGDLEQLQVSGRWDDADIVYVLSEDLRIQGSPGGPLQTVAAPQANLITLQAQQNPTGTLPAGTVNYRLTVVDAVGNEGPVSDATVDVRVQVVDAVTGATQSVLLSNLPVATTSSTRRLYRSEKGEYVLVAELNATDRTYLDTGTTLGGLLQPSQIQWNARLHAQLVVDPGVIVKLNGAVIEVSFGAQLLAEGSQGSEVVFTSLADVRYGAGGTFQTGGAGSAQPGDWAGLYGGPLGQVSLDHAVVAYGGGVATIEGTFTAFNVVEVQQAEARVTNSVLEHNAGGTGGQATANRIGRGSNAAAAIFVRGAQPVIVNNSLSYNAGPAININVNALNADLVTDSGRATGASDLFAELVANQGPLVRDNRMLDNDINGMLVRGGRLATEGIWDDTDITHVLQDDVSVPNFHTYGGLRLESSGSESLVVKLLGANAGFTAGGQALDISDRVGGTVQVIGQPGHPVVMTSAYDCTAGAGYRPDGTLLYETLKGTCGATSSGAPYADVIVVMDESGSMMGAQVFSVGMIQNLDLALAAAGVGDGTKGTNRYGLVGFGGDDGFWGGGNHQIGHSHLMPGGAVWGSAADYATAATTLTVLGFDEDGYSGIQYALDNYPFRSDATKFVILVTDEPRALIEPYLTYSTTLSALQAHGATLQGILSVSITDSVGNMALAADSHGLAYLADGLGGFTTAPVGSITDWWGGVMADYGDMVFATGGIVGDIYQINQGGLPATSFGKAMIASIVSQATGRVAAGDWDSIELAASSDDRSVAVATENETGNAMISGTNDAAGDAQYLGTLATDEKAGDDVRQLGFEIHGTLNRRADVDVYGFDAVAGTEVWLDIDRTTAALDTVVELIDNDGLVLARSDNSLDEAADPSLLYRDSQTMTAEDVQPLAKSPFIADDQYSTNPRDAGMRVRLPGPAGSTNTYHVRVRSSSSDLDNVSGGQTLGVYQLQIRLRETDEHPGSAVQMADIRYAANGIQLVGVPDNSPLTGEAAETITAAGTDANGTRATADELGNLLQTDQGTLSVAGALAAAGDWDWYRFEVQYTAIQNATVQVPRHLATTFDIDYADGFARANTNLWVFQEVTDQATGTVQARLVLSGRDSAVSDDQPTATGPSIDDLSRGSAGQLDAFIGSVELPAQGLQPGVYYVVVSSNARIPAELQQSLTRNAPNGLVRLEPINSVQRVAEDHVDNTGNVTTAESPQIPILFGADNVVTLVAPAGSNLRDGECFTLTNAAGNSQTYEFDMDGNLAAGRIAVPYTFTDTATQIGDALELAITDNPPASVDLTQTTIPDPTADAPVISSALTAYNSSGRVTLRERATTITLLNELITTNPFTNKLTVTPVTRWTRHNVVPTVRQSAAEGQSESALFVSRPAAAPYNLGDVALFVTEPGNRLNTTDVLTVDPLTGEAITSVGTIGAYVNDVAMHPTGYVLTGKNGNDGGLFAYSYPQVGTRDDANSGNYWEIDPSSTTGTIGVNLGDDGIVTNEVDPADATKAVVSNVGIQFHALTFSNSAVDNQQVHGFAVGNRNDGGAPGNTTPDNVLFEFNPTTGAAVNPTTNPANRTGAAAYLGVGTQIRDRGALDTSDDAFPIGSTNTTINGRDATTRTGTTRFDIEDGDYFQVDEDGDGLADVTFEFDTGPEFWMSVNTTDLLNPQVLRDGDRFTVDGVDYEFDTGSVLVVSATSGAQLVDGGTITITDDATPPQTWTFEFDNNSNAGTNIAIPFTSTTPNSQIVANIVQAINGVTGFGVGAVQLPATSRITLLGESTTTAATVSAPGVSVSGAPGVQAGPIAIRVEETFSVDQIGAAIMGVIDGTQRGGIVAGAKGNRLNFPDALSVSFAGVTTPVFGTVDLATGFTTGTSGTLNAVAAAIPFLASDSAAQIATRVQQLLVGTGFSSTLAGSTVRLDPATPQPIFMCTNLATPPQYGLRGTPDCPLQQGGVGPGGDITGIAFVGSQLYAVTDTGGLFRVANRFGGAFAVNSEFNVADYIDGSREQLAAVNTVTTTVDDPLTGLQTTVLTTEPIAFSGLVAGPANTEDGRYQNLLFAIDDTGRIFAFDTFGRPQAVFANGAYYVDTYRYGANGLAFATLDDNLWHVTDSRETDAGHGYTQTFDGSRSDQPQLNNPPTYTGGGSSFYFGYDGVGAQSQFRTNFAPEPTYTQDTYNFPGGAHGSLISNSFNLEGCSAGDRPTLYFNYFVETERIAGVDSFRAYISGDDGRWKLLTTNADQTTRPTGDYNDEYDPFYAADPNTGAILASQPFQRGETFDSTGGWRQARIDLSPYAGQDNLRLRFDFSTAGGMSSGTNGSFDLNTAGNELRAVAATALQDGDLFTLNGTVTTATGTVQSLVAGFEFDLGPTLAVPTGAAVDDGDTFAVDGTVYEFDRDNEVGSTNSIPHTPIALVGTETAEELAQLIQQVLTQYPPQPVEFLGDLTVLEPNDTLATALPTGLNGSTQVFDATGVIGDDMQTPDPSLDVDLVEFWLDAGDQVAIETNTRQLASQLDPYLRLFDAAGNQVTANNNVEPNNPYNRDARIEYTAAQRGKYYVGVSAAHNTNYDTSVSESGRAQGTVASQGPYQLLITVTDPNGIRRVGNRLNLPNAQVVEATGLPTTFVVGAGGVRASLPNPMAVTDPTQPPILVYPVRVHLGMDSLQVADAIQMALADHLANGNVSAIKTQNETVQVLQYGIEDPGPLGISGPSDPFLPGLFGDQFSSFGSAAAVYRNNLSAAAALQNNDHEGVYVDDVIIGFAGRGEMITGSTAATSPQFVANSQHAATDIDVGAYQLEIRQATEYGQSQVARNTLLLTDTFDIHDRLAEGITLTVAGGEAYADGQTFTVSDGTVRVTFEFEDWAASNGTAAANVAIPFESSDDAIVMARRIRDAINSQALEGVFAVTAVSGDGVTSGPSSTSNLVQLSGAASVISGGLGGSTATRVTPAEANDTLADATVTNIVPGSRDSYHAAGLIGDNADISPLGTDVDVYRVQLTEGELITVDIDAAELGSPLDALLRLFDANGMPVTLLDSTTGTRIPIASDDAGIPGDADWLDPYLAFTAPATGDYYIAVSGFDNSQYDPVTLGFGASAPGDLTVFNNALYFSAFTAATGRELWKVDATGTCSPVADLDPTGSSDPADLTVYNNELYFSATTPDLGRELWKIDATDTPSLVADIVPDADSSSPAGLTAFNGELYFSAFTSAAGRELWKLSATGVAALVVDIDPSGSSEPADLTEFNDQLYFAASTPTSGRELWRLNASGVAYRVTEINPVGSSDPAGLTIYNNELYFAAESPSSGRELWKVNVLGQVRLMADLDSAGSSDPANLAVYNGELFFAATTPATGRELWKLNAVGTPSAVADANPGTGSSDPSELTPFNGDLYFAATNATGGRELWKVTATGVATQVTTLNADGPAAPADLMVFNSELYFGADTAAYGRELWKLTAAETASPVVDLYQAARRAGLTGFYQIDIERPHVSAGIDPAMFDGRGDQNVERNQGQVVIRDNRISHCLTAGISVQAWSRTATGASQPGPARNLAQINTTRLVPGAAIVNNILVGNGVTGIDISGDAGGAGQQPAVVPFARIVNNTIVSDLRGSGQDVTLQLVKLPDTTGGSSASTAVYYANLSAINAPLITSLTIHDNSYNLGGTPGKYTGLDLDAVKLSKAALPTSATQVPGLSSLSVFDFTPAGTALVGGTQLAPVDAALFGTLNGQVNNAVATLGSFDANATIGTGNGNSGFISLGLGGEITFNFTQPVSTAAPLYLYIGEADDRGELSAASVTVTTATPPAGVGIRVRNNASPTILNNLFSTLTTGIDADASSATTVVAGSLYQNNTQNATGIGEGTYAVYADPGDRLFVAASTGNYYPAPLAPQIDRGKNTVEDRFEMTQVRTPLGIAPAPILAPTYDADGQLRTDDPAVSTPTGLGENVFIDIGALDRADFAGPTVTLTNPRDNGNDDLDPGLGLVNLSDAALRDFAIQVVDGSTAVGGSVVDDLTITGSAVHVKQNNVALVQGVDYTFSYDTTSHIIRLTPLAGVWDQDSNYVIELTTEDHYVILALSGDKITDGQSFELTDEADNKTVFEYDSGYVLTVPETWALQVPASGGRDGGVADGDTITVSDGITTVIFELDSDGVTTADNVPVTFTLTSTQGEIADRLVAALAKASLGLAPVNTGNGLVHLGVNGTQIVAVNSATIQLRGVARGVTDGDTFTVDNGSRFVTFEFNTDGRVTAGNVSIVFGYGQTQTQVANAIVSALLNSNLGLSPRNLGDGRIQVGGGLNHLMDVTLSPQLTLTGQPGVRLPWGFRLPTKAGSFSGLLADGDTFSISNGVGLTVTFEFDSNKSVTAPNTAVSFTSTTTTDTLVNTLVATIRSSRLGLYPYNAGNGIVILGGNANYSLNVGTTALTQVGQPGLPGTVAIPFTPDESFTAEDVAQAISDAINGQEWTEVTATPEGSQVVLLGARSVVGSLTRHVSGVRDLAGNSLQANQPNGETRFTIYIGTPLDYGDAPAPYPTLLADNGARHAIISGFSLGPTVRVNADGQPSDDATGDDDEDGVTFDPTTPLLAGRKFKVTVTTQGIVDQVVSYGVLDAWIDWNQNGSWNDAGEHIITNAILTPSVLDSAGAIAFTNLSIPGTALVGDTYARFRLSTTGGQLPTGEAPAGEVEDYLVTLQQNPWQNPVIHCDVNNDAGVSPMDVLLVINYINAHPGDPTLLPTSRPNDMPYLDVNGDGYVTAADVLVVINYVKQQNSQSGSGEGEAASLPVAASQKQTRTSSQCHLDDVLRPAEDWSEIIVDIEREQRRSRTRDAFFAELGLS